MTTATKPDEWVPQERMHPMCNVFRRRYRTNLGREGVFYPNYLMDSGEWITHWHFPDYS